MRLCQVPGCEGQHHAKGLCLAHYRRKTVGGDVSTPIRRVLTGSAIDRLLAGLEYDTNGGCWLWRYGAHPSGYGTIHFEGRLHKAHRLAYAAMIGPIPTGLVVCHRCDVPACFNPAHLFLGTQDDNITDMVTKGRRVQGALFCGDENSQAKLTEAEAIEVIAAARAGESYTSIGLRFGIARVTATRIAAGKSWRHLSQKAVA